MNAVQGSISGIRTQSREGGSATSFRLHAAEGRETQVEATLHFPWREGDLVCVTGEVNSDLVLIASTIEPVSKPAEPVHKARIYKFRVIVAAVLGNLIGLVLALANIVM